MRLKSKYKFIFVCIFFCSIFNANAQLKVSENGHFLMSSKGKPFFWLGDTGWALFQKLTQKDVKKYLKVRSQQGFSVIHAAVYNDNPFVLPPRSNMYGDSPFINNDPSQPNVTSGKNPKDSMEYDYWDHVGFIVDQAKKEGLYILMLPIFGVAEGDGYNLISEKNAYQYGKFIGARFKDKTNIIWCMGGDVTAENKIKKKVWNLLARGVTEGVCGVEDYGKTFMTFHTRGGSSSSNFFMEAPWLDFHLLQTWSDYNSIYEVVLKDYKRKPAKPILHGEGAYEDGPEYPTKPITPELIRKQAYWAFFAGGMHTYGNSNVWNFGTNPFYVTQNWKGALKSKGAKNLSKYREILESLDWWKFIPDQTILLEDHKDSQTGNVAMSSSDKTQILIYFSNPSSAKIDMTLLNRAKLIQAYWINPQTGARSKRKDFAWTQNETFTVPRRWEDALLLIETE